MPQVLGHLLVAASVTIVVGVVSGGGWAYFLVGAILALSLWVMLFAGSYATPDAAHGRVSTRQYALAAAVAVVLGYVFSVTGGGPTWWGVGVILAGIMVPATTAAVRGSGADDRA